MQKTIVLCCLYLRMSNDKQETSIGDQRAACEAYAKSHGYRIVCEYADEGISGDDTRRRREFQRMIDDAGNGQWQVVLCWDQDRFGRFDPLEAGYWIQPLRNHHIRLETVGQGRIDWEDFAGRIVYAVAQEGKHAYLRDLSKNVNRGMLSAAKQGKVLSSVPRGYLVRDGVVEIDETEAPLIREIFASYADGASLREIAGRLNKRGVAPRRSSQWSASNVRKILTNEYYAGVYRWGETVQARYSEVSGGAVVAIRGKRSAWGRKAESDVVRIERHHPEIVDGRVFAGIQSRLTANRRCTFPHKGAAAFALSGLLSCGMCGAPMYGIHRRGRDGTKRGRVYKCSTHLRTFSCQSNVVEEGDVLEVVQQGIIGYFTDGARMKELSNEVRRQLADKSRRPDSRSTENRLAAVRAKLAKAKVRLVECDRDMLEVVQSHLRVLGAEEVQLAAEVERLQAAGRLTVKDHEDQVREIVRTAERLGRDRLCRDDADELRKEFAGLVSRIEIFATVIPNGERRSYALDHVVIAFRMGTHLSLSASRRDQVCSIWAAGKSGDRAAAPAAVG